MSVSVEILNMYKQGKYQKCVELIKLMKSNDDIENLLLENCQLVCESLLKIQENDPDKIYEMQEQLYLFYEKVTSTQIIPNSIPLQLKLTATFNFIFWLLFYNDIDLTLDETEEYLEIVNNAILRGKEVTSFYLEQNQSLKPVLILLNHLKAEIIFLVLGRQVTSLNAFNASEKILSNIKLFKDLIVRECYKTVLLILELAVLIILYVVKVKRTLIQDFSKVVSLFIEESEHTVNSIALANEFLEGEELTLCLFKFNLGKTASLYLELNSKVFEYLNILESALMILLEDFKGSLKSLKKIRHTNVQSLWNYLVILCAYELEDWDLCSGFLIKMSSLVVQKNLKARLHIMQGKFSSVKRNHKKALQQFANALTLSPNCPIIYYYIGQEYGKMGLIDLMVENFEKLIQVLILEGLDDDFKSDFETTLLDWIHPVNEITETEAYYALAVSYGLNENFKCAAETFEKILSSNDEFSTKRIVELPNFLTILHEASIINLLLGNLARAEQIALDAIDRYLPHQSFRKRYHRNTLLWRDIKWLEKVIQQELLGTDLEPEEYSEETYYSEDLVFFFSQNVIALLILFEIQRIQEVEDHKMTISNIFSIFSKYLALMSKKDEMDEDEKHVLLLVKALAGKTCVKIASIQVMQGQDSDAEKMFQRALICSRGDKDALYNYYKFLLKKGKSKEALKLWSTFFKEKVAFKTDCLQSFSLRYFLTDKISKRDLENIQREIDSANDKFS